MAFGVSHRALICAAFALVPQAAFAQTVPGPAPTPETTATPTANPTASENATPPSGAIVVTGIRAAINKDLAVKRRANSIVDSISAEDIGKLPDANIAEAIQRVPGVSIDREGGEGRHISINGLGPEFSMTLFNGRQIATTDTGRSFSYDTIASNLVSRIDVYKAINANNMEGGLGGTVDVRTARPFDFPGFTASAQASYQYDGNSKDGYPQASFLVSDRFLNGKLGVLLSFTHQKRHNLTRFSNSGGWSRNYFVDPVCGCYAGDESDDAWRLYNIYYGTDDVKRTRDGGTAVLQFQATDSVSLIPPRPLRRDFWIVIMHFEGNYRNVGAIDVGPLKDAVLALGEEDWNASTFRQENHPAHVQTHSIQLIYDEEFSKETPTRWPMMDRFEPVLAPAIERIRSFYRSSGAGAEGYFARIVLVRLMAGGEIRSHTDYGSLLTRSHRIHLPIVTNDDALFAVRGDIRHLPPGEMWEINNRRPHAVRNGGAARIHAIFDYVIPGELIDDPAGALIA